MNMRVTTQGQFAQGVALMQKQSQNLSDVQSQLASNQRYSRAGQDPIAAGRALNVDKALADTTQWQSNIGTATDRLNLEESALADANNSLSRVRELAVQANTSTLSDSDRQSIAAEMQQRLKELMDQGNARDGQGAYLFGGSRTQTPPFQFAAGSVQYQGDSLTTQLPIGSNRDIAIGDSGADTFLNIPSGDGRLNVAVSPANQGSAQVQGLSMTDASQWDGGTYSVKFSAGNYSVLDASGNTVSSGAYQSGQSIPFRGASLNVSGTPADGDQFTVSASQPQDVFSTVQKLIGLVSSSGRSPAQAAQDQTSMYSALQSLDTALNQIGNVRGGVGARLNVLQDASSQLQSRSNTLKQTLSGLRDTDYTSAAAKLSQTQTTLQAAQQSYIKIQGLSLFDYLR